MNRTSFVALLSSGLFAGGGAMVGLSFGAIFLGLGGLVPAMSGSQLVELFPLYWTAIALTIIPVALVKTVALAIVAFRRQAIPGVRRFWRWAFGLWMVNCALTAGYHVQVVIASFMGKYAPEEMVSTIQVWIALHWIRVLLALASFVLAIVAVSKTSQGISERAWRSI